MIFVPSSRLPVALAVPVRDGVPDEDGVAESVPLLLADEESDSRGVPEGVIEPVAPRDSGAVGDAERVDDRDAVDEPESEPDGVCDAVPERVCDGVCVEVAVGVTLTLVVGVVDGVRESEPVDDAVAPSDLVDDGV